MNARPGMHCTDHGLTDLGMHASASNDRPAFGWSEDTVDPYSAADLMGMACWVSYVERWNPLRYVPPPLRKSGARRRGRGR